MLSMTRVAQAVKAPLIPDNYLEVITRTGTGTTVTTTTPTPLNLSGNGGLILTKNYTGTHAWSLVDTVRGVSSDLEPSTTAAATTQSTGITSVSSTGYTTGTLAKRNSNTLGFVDYVMRQGPKFLQIIQQTATGSAVNVNHNLGIRPGFILAKSTTLTHGWCCWHRFVAPTDFSAASTGFSTNATAAVRYVSYSDVTATFFNNEIYSWNGSTQTIAYQGGTVVYYVFGHDPSPSGRIQCWGYTGNGSTTGPVIELGWTPRLLIIKSRSTGNWVVLDTSRGLTSANDAVLNLNLANAQTSSQWVDPTPTGFQIKTTVADLNTADVNYMYVAFR